MRINRCLLQYNQCDTPTSKMLNQGNGVMSSLNTKASAQLLHTRTFNSVNSTAQNASAAEQIFRNTDHVMKSTLCSDL